MADVKSANELKNDNLSNDDEDDEYDEEPVEPVFRYERMKNDVVSMLQKCPATYMAVHSKFLAVGTQWGEIYIFDLDGNQIKMFTTHSTTVNYICIDDGGNFIASCSDDGKVHIASVFDNEYKHTVSFNNPIKAVALDPLFAKSGSGNRFVTGDYKLILYEKGLLGAKTSPIHDFAESAVLMISWRGPFIVWTNEQAVNVFDVTIKKRISIIKRPETSKGSYQAYPCSIFWKKPPNSFVISWGKTIQVCSVVDEGPSWQSPSGPPRKVEVVDNFNLDAIICDIAIHSNRLLAILYDDTDIQWKVEGNVKTKITESPHPELAQIEELEDGSHDTPVRDQLAVKGFQNNFCAQYHLAYLPADNLCFIVSPHDIIVVKERTQDDHVKWLIEQNKFEEALAVCQEHGKSLTKFSYQEVGVTYLKYFLEIKKYNEAARLCVRILGKNKELWETEVIRFEQIRMLSALAPYLPRENPQLSSVTYEKVLKEFLLTDQQAFLKYIREWPAHLYSLQVMIDTVKNQLYLTPQDPYLLQALADLYVGDCRYDQALEIYLKLKHPCVFDVIHKHNLIDKIVNHVTTLMEFDTKSTVELLLNHVDKMPVDVVVEKLKYSKDYVYVYLSGLFEQDSQYNHSHYDRLVVLYAECEKNDSSKLLRFLRICNKYKLESALRLCEQYERTEEVIYLLARMGNTKKALKKRMEEQGKDTVIKAINFCKEHNDPELWEDLINHSLNKPSFIIALLENIGTHVNPEVLIQKIPCKLKIEGLRDALVRIMQDYRIQISLQEGFKQVLAKDVKALENKFFVLQKRAVRIEDGQLCQACQKIVVDREFPHQFVIFMCRHVYHEECLLDPSQSANAYCHACQSRRSNPYLLTRMASRI